MKRLFLKLELAIKILIVISMVTVAGSFLKYLMSDDDELAILSLCTIFLLAYFMFAVIKMADLLKNDRKITLGSLSANQFVISALKTTFNLSKQAETIRKSKSKQ